MMFTETPLASAYQVNLSVRSDNRGWFARTYDKQAFAQIGNTADWVQMNHSLTHQRGALRGMHFKHPPVAEIKLVRCITGRVFDVIIDLRARSPTLLHWFGTELSDENQQMFYIPEEFAHGFQTLTTDCQMVYYHSEYYAPYHKGAVRYDGLLIRVNRPLLVVDLSERDATHPHLDACLAGLTL